MLFDELESDDDLDFSLSEKPTGEGALPLPYSLTHSLTLYAPTYSVVDLLIHSMVTLHAFIQFFTSDSFIVCHSLTHLVCVYVYE